MKNLNNHIKASVDLLDQYGLKDIRGEKGFDRYTRLAANLFQVPIAFISVVDKNKIQLLSAFGITELSQLGCSLCTSTIEAAKYYVASDTLAEFHYQAKPLGCTSPVLRAYAGIPLKTKTGYSLGTLSIGDNKPRLFSEDEIKVLSETTDMLMDYMELRHAAKQAKADCHASVRQLAHDLKGPLTFIYLQTELIKIEKGVSGDIIEMATQINEAGKKMTGIINNLAPPQDQEEEQAL